MNIALLQTAINARKSINKITNAMRLVNGQGDQLDGLIIDRYATHMIIYLYSKVWRNDLEAIKAVLVQHFFPELIVVKDRSESATSKSEDIKASIIYGKAMSTTIVQEYDVSFNVDINDGLNAGLFLDMRANRHKVGRLCRDKKVLNCFAYTCAFGVHARAQGAREVVNVDLSKNYLTRGASNYALNNLPVGQGEFLNFDAVKFLSNCVRKKNCFDVIILDPPSFARGKKTDKTFQIKRDLPQLIKEAVAILTKGGVLFVSTNCSELTHAHLEQMVDQALNGRTVKSMERMGQDKDFVGSNTFKESYLVGLCMTLLL